LQSLRGSNRSGLKQTINRVLSACKRPTNQRLCKRFLSQLRSLFEDDYEDEESPLVGAFECTPVVNEALEECKLDFSCWKRQFPNLRTCLRESKPNAEELIKCKALFLELTKCPDGQCLLDNLGDSAKCVTAFVF
jgi:hypothetical protein